MKRIVTIFSLALFVALTIQAQSDLAINQAFEHYGHGRGCKMVVLHNTQFRGYDLAVYQSLIYRIKGDDIAQMLQTDRKHAKRIREVVNNGRVESGYYMLAPTSKGLNRYILFNSQTNSKGVIVYIEGALSPADIMKICYTKTNQ